MKHDILGEVKLSDGRPFDATVVVQSGSRDIQFVFNGDDQPLAITISLVGAAFVVAL